MLWTPKIIVKKATLSIVVTRAGESDPDPTFPAVALHNGRNVTTALLQGGPFIPKWIGWGTGVGTTTATDTDLFTPATESRVSGVITVLTSATPNDTAQIQGTITCQGAPKTISNMCAFDSPGGGTPPSGGNAFVKGDFQGNNVALNVGDSIQGTFLVEYV